MIPDRVPQMALIKLLHEVGELFSDPSDPGELADVLIIMLDLCKMAGHDPGKIIYDKMGINVERKWTRHPVSGVVEHIRETQ